MLASLGVDATLRIGVEPRGNGSLGAHAWLDVADQTVLGGAESPHRYAVLPKLPM
jgi:hypothetical protein